MKLLTEKEEEEVAATSRDWSDRSKFTFFKILFFNKHQDNFSSNFSLAAKLDLRSVYERRRWGLCIAVDVDATH